jgi:hypothetical protein
MSLVDLPHHIKVLELVGHGRKGMCQGVASNNPEVLDP